MHSDSSEISQYASTDYNKDTSPTIGDIHTTAIFLWHHAHGGRIERCTAVFQ